LIEGRKP